MRRVSLPEKVVGSAFALGRRPIRHTLYRRLQPFRLLPDCSELLPAFDAKRSCLNNSTVLNPRKIYPLQGRMPGHAVRIGEGFRHLAVLLLLRPLRSLSSDAGIRASRWFRRRRSTAYAGAQYDVGS